MAAEKQFENKVKRWLESVGVYDLGTPESKMGVPPVGYYEKRWGGGMSKAGLPDMHVVVNGINLDVELKAPNGRPSALQRVMIRQINACGSFACVLYPSGFEAFQKIILGVMSCGSAIAVLNALKTAHSSTDCVILKELPPFRMTMQEMP